MYCAYIVHTTRNLYLFMLIVILAVPHISKVLVCNREIILNAKETLQMLLDQNNDIRMSIDMVLVSIVRPLLRKLDIAFKPGLSRVQWLSSDLKLFTTYVQEVRENLLLGFEFYTDTYRSCSISSRS